MTDTTPFTPRAAPEIQRCALREAIGARGLKRFAFFGTCGEGRIYPNGVEEASGYVLNGDGRVWSFWTGWDDAGQHVVIDEWTEESITPLLASGHEYERARRELGLA